MKVADIQRGCSQRKRLFSLPGRVPWLAVLWGLAALPAVAQVGATFEELKVKGAVYHGVKVLSATPSTMTIRHAGGLTQVPLNDLSEDLQARMGYRPEAAAEFDRRNAKSENERREAEALQQAEAATQAPAAAIRTTHDGPLSRALARFGQPADLHGIDLREQFRAFDLHTKDQGFRPSCSVYAVLGALEFQEAVASGQPERFSEEYVIWATRKMLGYKAGEKRRTPELGDRGEEDAGFSLGEVLAAVRAYGLPLQSEMPPVGGLGMEDFPEPDDSVVASARGRRQVAIVEIPGRDNEVRVQNIIHVLNEGIPVVIGLYWPHGSNLRGVLLRDQVPIQGYRHAVTLVGVVPGDESNAPQLIMRNSWGPRWGVGGYGYIDIHYLERQLLEALVLDVRPGGG